MLDTTSTPPDHESNGNCRLSTRRVPDHNWQQHFLAMLPPIRRHAHVCFRYLPVEAREELVQETVARALLDYCRLVEQKKLHLARASSLARFAVAQVRSGRRVGARLNCKDVSSAYCQRRKGVILNSLDGQDDDSGSWREILVADRQTGPAETAVARMDFSTWLNGLPARSRQLAERLASGETTSSAARLFGISRGRVSQLRRELDRAWHTFQAEPAMAK